MATLEDFSDELWDEKKLSDKAMLLMAFVQEHATAYERLIAYDDLTRVMLFIAGRTERLNAELVDGPPECPGGPRPHVAHTPLIRRVISRSGRADTFQTCTTTHKPD